MLTTLVEAPSNTRRVFSAPIRRELSLNELPLQVLAAVAAYGPSGIVELASRLALSRGSVSSIVSELAERDLVETPTDVRDRRRRTVHLSANGRAVVERLLELAEDALAAPE